jgi:hypothetical protein
VPPRPGFQLLTLILGELNLDSKRRWHSTSIPIS